VDQESRPGRLSGVFSRRLAACFCLEPGRPVRGLRCGGRRFGRGQYLAPPAPRHISDLDTRPPRGPFCLEPPRWVRPVHGRAALEPRIPVTSPLKVKREGTKGTKVRTGSNIGRGARKYINLCIGVLVFTFASFGPSLAVAGRP